jgi:hypothetical protein
MTNLMSFAWFDSLIFGYISLVVSTDDILKVGLPLGPINLHLQLSLYLYILHIKP